jgi:hypothetical protein
MENIIMAMIQQSALGILDLPCFTGYSIEEITDAYNDAYIQHAMDARF